MKPFNVHEHLIEVPKSYKKALFDYIENFDDKKLRSKFSSERKKSINKLFCVSCIYKLKPANSEDDNYSYAFDVSIYFVDSKKFLNVNEATHFTFNDATFKRLARAFRYSVFDRKNRFSDNEVKINENFSYLKHNTSIVDYEFASLGDGCSITDISQRLPSLGCVRYYVDVSNIEDDSYLSFNGFFDFIMNDDLFLKVSNSDIKNHYGLNQFRHTINSTIKESKKTKQATFVHTLGLFSFLFAYAHFDKPFSFNEFHKQLIKIDPHRCMPFARDYFDNVKDQDYVKIMSYVDNDLGSGSFQSCLDVFGSGKDVKFFPTLEAVNLFQDYLKWYYSIQFTKKYYKKYDLNLKKEINPIWVP